MKLDDLTLLHIYSYLKPRGQQCPLKKFTKAINPLTVSTCMRHIYICSTPQLLGHEDKLERLKESLDNPGAHQAPAVYDVLQGREAYSWLLYWVVGGLNNKNPVDDIRNLGGLRNTLHATENSNKGADKKAWLANKAVALALREDARKLLAWVQDLPKEMDLKDKQALVQQACENCTWAREQGLPNLPFQFDYSCFASKEAMMEHLGAQLTRAEERTKKEQVRLRDSLSDLGFLFSESNSHLEERLAAIAAAQSKFFPQQNHLQCD